VISPIQWAANMGDGLGEAAEPHLEVLLEPGGIARAREDLPAIPDAARSSPGTLEPRHVELVIETAFRPGRGWGL